jgi:uncharacterized protein YdaU (DUF1376 family)
MSELPWVRFFPSDWLGGTRGMSAAETGIYITLIATMYERGEPIPEDHKRLARLCGASNAAFKSALETLINEGKIERVDGGLWNERVGKESEFRSEKSQVGRQAANARWNKKDNENNVSDDANAMPSQSERNANQKPEARVEKTEPTGSAKKRSSRLPEDWVLPDEWRAVAIDMGFPSDRIDAEAARMRDWSRSSKNGAKLDWLASWRNWVRGRLDDNPSWKCSALPAGPKPIVLRSDDPLVPVLERIRGKPMIFGQRGTASISPDEYNLAKEQAA